MTNVLMPIIESTKDFILIKIPKTLVSPSAVSKTRLSKLEQGLQESFLETNLGKLKGPYRTTASFLRALKKQSK